MSDFELFFNDMFFGVGFWLGLLLIVGLMVAVSLIKRYVGVLVLPVAVYMGLEYLTYDLPWGSVVMLLTGVFIMFQMAQSKD